MREHARRDKKKTGMTPLHPNNRPEEGHEGEDGQAVEEDTTISKTCQNDISDRFVNDIGEQAADGRVDESTAVFSDVQRKMPTVMPIKRWTAGSIIDLSYIPISYLSKPSLNFLNLQPFDFFHSKITLYYWGTDGSVYCFFLSQDALKE